MVVALQDLTVSDVSGMIAVGIALVQVFIPIALPMILLGFLKSPRPTLSASTWSALAREIHSSYWPTILSTDSSASSGVYRAVSVVSWLGTAAKILTAVAAVVTPLGLYQSIVPQSPTSSQFHYVEDTSVFGDGTPSRNTTTRFSRICGGFEPVNCPHSHGNVTWSTNATGTYVTGDWYDSHIPQYVVESFQSGLSTMEPSVSSLFDIQARYTVLSQTVAPGSTVPVDNSTGHPVSWLRPIQSLITDRGYRLVEGLVVDLQDGGIGFRNHSAPQWRPHGSEWSEDLLFIEPETQCVDLNLTLDYDVATIYSSGPGGYENLVLTDRGGFANLPTHFSPLDWTTIHNQRDPELVQRAFTGAWVNNFVSMIFLNVTNPRNYNNSGEKAFSYLDSHTGKKFPFMRAGTTTSDFSFFPGTGIQVSNMYGSYTDGLDYAYTGVNASGIDSSKLGNLTQSEPALYSNPFHIGEDNFTSAATLCGRTTLSDYANMSNVVASCGLVYGVPQRQTAGSPLMFSDPGSRWSIPLYSCASGVRATIKTVTFRFNGSDDLSGLKVGGISPKTYPDNASKPLWGVENTRLQLGDVHPLWGLVSPESARKLGLSTVRQEHLWLPGTSELGIVSTRPDTQNLPGVDFYITALAGAYDVSGEAAVGGFFDYTGSASYSLLRQWQQLSQTTTGTARILNLVWTDIAANYVLGTRSLATSPGNGSNSEHADTTVPDIPVVFYDSRVRFHPVYGIPAFLTLLMTALVCAFALGSIFLQGSGPRRMTTFLNWTSTGRIFTSLNPDSDEIAILLSPKPSKNWIEEEGRHEITVTDQGEEETAKPNTEQGDEESAGPNTEHEDNAPPPQQPLLQHAVES